MKLVGTSGASEGNGDTETGGTDVTGVGVGSGVGEALGSDDGEGAGVCVVTGESVGVGSLFVIFRR